MAAPVHVAVTNGLIPVAQADCSLTGNKLLIAFTQIALTSSFPRIIGFLQVLNHLGVTTIKRLDQGHLHPKLHVTILTCHGWASAVGGEHSRKELYEQLI
jgi:hypothetical protein